VHTLGVSYDSAASVGIYNKDSSGHNKMDGVIRDLVQIGIPMFFYISGFSSSYTKTEKKMAYGRFVWGKCTRIIFPFIVAIPLFLIPALWLQCTYASTAIDGAVCGDSFMTWFKAYIVAPVEILNHISWLWYLPAMFVDFCLTYPLLRWTKRRQAKLPFGRGDIEVIILQLITSGVWIAINYQIMGDHSDGLCAHLTMTSGVTLTVCLFIGMAF